MTAQKRSESADRVGLTIAAISGDALRDQRLSSVQDLASVVPGLIFSRSSGNAPVYTMRGVGFYETSLAATPAVSVYVDEVPLPFPALTTHAGFDLERVEVLKGPQGTLFGQNSTGGAINYIIAKPTDDLSAGFDVGFGRFNTFENEAFVSGPLSPTLTARASVKFVTGGDWQRSYTRPDDTLGAQNLLAGRLQLAWQPADALRVSWTMNGWLERSDSQAGQYVALRSQAPALTPPALAAYRFAPDKARAADWSPDLDLRSSDELWQTALRIEYDLNPDITLTSVSGYTNYGRDQGVDNDGVALNNTDLAPSGAIRSFSQELRLASSPSRSLRWLAGVNYETSDVDESVISQFDDSTGFAALRITRVRFESQQEIDSKAAFASVEYDLGAVVTLKGGLRYTDSQRPFAGGTFDSGDGTAAAVFSFLSSLLTGSAVTVAQGGCLTLGPNLRPQLVDRALDEDNLSWRVGADFCLGPQTLLYLNATKDYKTVSFPTLSASSATQYDPVTQESVFALEGGAKLRTQDDRVAVTAAAFHYRYRDKQLKTRVIDPIFGILDALDNIPKSSITGAEITINAVPVRGLTIRSSATWLHARIDEYTGVNANGILDDFAGSPIPYTPKWQLAAGFTYKFSAGSRSLFVGADTLYHSATFAAVGTEPSAAAIGRSRDLAIKAYATLDLRAGIESADGRWRLSIWGKNVTGTYYWTNVQPGYDTIFRYAGRPATFGIAVSHRH